MAEDVNQTLPDATGQQAQRTFTQDEVNAIAARARQEARSAAERDYAVKYGDLDDLVKKAIRAEELEAEQMSETDRLRKQIDDLKAENERAAAQTTAARLSALRLKVGQELGLPPMLAERLAGEDEETLKADGQKVLATLKEAGRPVLPNINATEGALAPTGPAKVKLTPEQEAALKKAQAVDPSMTSERYIAALIASGQT